MDPLNISLFSFLLFQLPSTSVALLYSPTILRVSEVCPKCPHISATLTIPLQLPGGLGPAHPPSPMGWPFRFLDRLSPAAAQAQAVDQSAAGKPLGAPSLCVSVCGSHTITMPLGGRVGHGVHRVYTGRLHTAVGNRHLLVLQKRKRER